MKKGIIGKKLGMTQIFDEKGNVIPVTLIEAGPWTFPGRGYLQRHDEGAEGESQSGTRQRGWLG